MANCNNCIKINPIPHCATSWVVGNVDPSYDTVELDFTLTNKATGNVYSGTTDTVDGDGLVTITLDDDLLELMNHYYVLKLYGVDTIEIEIGIDADLGCCVEFTTLKTEGDTIIFSTDSCTSV